MQRGLGRPAAGARRAGIKSRWWRVGALLLGLSASACANIGQIGNLTEGSPAVSVAFESLDGPPPAVSTRLVQALKEEAGARQIAVVMPRQANYRLRGYVSPQADGGGNAIAWAWDIYDAKERRVFRLRGSERAEPGARTAWDGAGDTVVRRIARAGIEQFATFAAAAGRGSAAPAVAAAPTIPARGRAILAAWIDDWTPEAAGIFRIFRAEQPAAGATASAHNVAQADGIPLPRARPAAAAESLLAFAAPHD